MTNTHTPTTAPTTAPADAWRDVWSDDREVTRAWRTMTTAPAADLTDDDYAAALARALDAVS